MRYLSKKTASKAVKVIGAILLLLVVFVIIRERHLVYYFQTNADPAAAIACDSTLWQYNAEKEDVAMPCITITGTVMSRHSEDDGDENIQLKPDPEYVHLLNIWNVLGQWGNMAIEPICENTPAKKEFKKACQGYTSNLTLPGVGDRVRVTGSYGTDKHSWFEIHPVTKIEVIK